MYNDIADIYLEIFPLNQAFLDFIPQYLGAPGGAVLDLGCGPGDYIDVLSKGGYRGVGIDSSETMIAQAQAQKQGTFHHLSFAEISQLEMAAARGFACAYCVGNSLSYLPEDSLGQFLNDVQVLLNASGHFILQVVNWDKLYQIRSSDFPVNPISEGRTFHRRYEWINHARVIFHTQIRKADQVIASWAAPLYPKYMHELLAGLQAVDLTVTGQYGDYQKSPFDPQSSPAIILVAQK